MAVSLATDQHEIASYISDDFDLICKSILIGESDSFLAKLLQNYREGKLL